ncbi:MAG: hypothetical protein GC182_08735 [Rhodopseudomonas sp.]|nr:hypothetical protein [Rhodopseudomonas sp.]
MPLLQFTIAEVLALAVDPHPSEDLAAFMTVRSYDGHEFSIGLGPKAVETLVVALIENSPRTPGTPGRN